MFPTRRPSRDIRILAAAAVAAITAIALGACTATSANEPAPVEFDDLQSATIQIQAQGTFIDKGTTNASETAGRGSGFLIDPSGIAVTNNHVVTGAGTLKVWLGGDTDREYGATVLGASECLDLAVIQLDADELPFMAWREGEIKNALDVYSAGFPLGDPEFTLTKGIVSKADTASEDAWASLDHVIEHDARIRGGNSGGPLVDSNGRVVGVNYAGIDELDYNYAIHRDQVMPVIEDLTAGKPVLSLGINAEAMPPADDGSAVGIWVASVKAGGPADEAGVESGDLLVDMAGISLGQNGTLEDYCRVLQTQGTEAIDVTLYRPATEELWEGQFNGRALELVSRGDTGGGGTGGAETVGSFVTVTDDSGAVTVQVPDTWTDVGGAGYTDDAGAQWFDISASPDLNEFFTTWTVAGVSVSASRDLAGTDTAAYLAAVGAKSVGDACTLRETDVYDDGYYTGHYTYWTACDGVSDYVVVVANDSAGTHLVMLRLQMLSELDRSTVLETIVSSFMAKF
ncbi:S1C family serine protease [Salinibacterium sp. ZJ450]|uniref:S1C family serine protease n=1 Tax=Salinibacterium sp. ZJ450 TaxID=2708338 RepID=UPI001420F760|nr:trypsin-like peptidase domain-containing protein [Salinibacterium sp. ZJ450]